MRFFHETDATMLFGHFEIAGFEMHSGQVIEEGFDMNVFKQFELVASGHFHKKTSYINMSYLGTQYQITWADYGEVKGFHIFDTETGKLEFVANDKPLFRKVWYDDSDGMTIPQIEQLIEPVEANTWVKVIVSNKDDAYMFDMFVDRLQQVGCAAIKVVEDHHHFADIDEDDLVDQAEDTPTILRKYVQKMNIDNEERKNQVNSVLVELYSEAHNQ